MNVYSLGRYLQSRGHEVTVESLRRVGGGASRETWLVELAGTLDGLAPLVLLRRDRPGGATVPTSLEREFDVLRGLFTAGVAVAEPFWYEADDAVFGSPFYLRQGFDGGSDQSLFTGESAHRLSVNLARAIAQMHAADPHAIVAADRPLPITVDDALTAEIEHWYDGWLLATSDPSPFLREVTWWLRRNRPSVAEPPVIVWGDVGVANTVCSPAGEVLALSDFELTTFGDPMRDVASALWRGVGDLAGRDTFLDAYVAASGRAIDEDRIAYYDVFFNWQVAMFIQGAARPNQPPQRNLHPALLQIWAQRMNLHKAGRRIGV